MFVYSEVAVELQFELFNGRCRDYIRVLQTYMGESGEEEAVKDNERPLPAPWQPHPCLLVRNFNQFAKRIRDFTVYADDIWIVSYPKCGTTWAQEMVWLLANKLDYETAKAVDINQRSPFFELSCMGPNLPIDSLAVVERTTQRPRVIKCHLPLNLLPAALFRINPRIIYVTRNAKDAAISYFHHYRMLFAYNGTLATFLAAFLAGDLIYGSHTRHTEDFVRLRKLKSNLLLLRYEDMKGSMATVLQQTAAFLGVTGISELEMATLVKHLSFEEMRQNKACNNEAMSSVAMAMNGRAGEGKVFHFLRKGQIGTYVAEMPQHFVEKFNAAEARESDELRFYISP